MMWDKRAVFWSQQCACGTLPGGTCLCSLLRYGQLSGMVEPLAGLFGAFAVVLAEPVLPYALAFAAGAMVYVVMDDIIPEAQIRWESFPALMSLSLSRSQPPNLPLFSLATPLFAPLPAPLQRHPQPFRSCAV